MNTTTIPTMPIKQPISAIAVPQEYNILKQKIENALKSYPKIENIQQFLKFINDLYRNDKELQQMFSNNKDRLKGLIKRISGALGFNFVSTLPTAYTDNEKMLNRIKFINMGSKYSFQPLIEKVKKENALFEKLIGETENIVNTTNPLDKESLDKKFDEYMALDGISNRKIELPEFFNNFVIPIVKKVENSLMKQNIAKYLTDKLRAKQFSDTSVPTNIFKKQRQQFSI